MSTDELDIFAEFLEIQTENHSQLTINNSDNNCVELLPRDGNSQSRIISNIKANNNKNNKEYISPAVRYISSLKSKASQETMHYALNRVAKVIEYKNYKVCPWEGINVDVVNYILGKLRADDLSPKTINTYLTAIKQVCRNAWLDHLMSHDTYLRISDIKGEKGTRISKGRSLSSTEIRKLLSTCINANKPINIRDAAIIALTRGCGLRRAEVTLLTNQSINNSTGIIIVRGKGDKERKLAVPKSILPIVNKWIIFKEGYDWKNSPPEHLFNPLHKTGRVLSKPMSAMAIHNMLNKRREEAEIEKFSPHDLRRTFATELLRNDIDLNDVQLMMGHANISTTQIYDKRDNERVLDIMANTCIL